MDENRLLCGASNTAVKWRAGPRSKKTPLLGEAVRQLMDDFVSPRQAIFSAVEHLWNELLPAELARHCRLADIAGGQLKVFVDSPPYMHELRLCSPELLGQFDRRCPQARIKRIQFAIG
jgi:hypothetical protein